MNKLVKIGGINNFIKTQRIITKIIPLPIVLNLPNKKNFVAYYY